MTRNQLDNSQEGMNSGDTTFAYRDTSVLLHAPTSNDAQLTAQFLAEAGLRITVCEQVKDLLAENLPDCGAILIAEEALGDSAMPLLLKTLADQPPWSDIPVIIITTMGEANRMRLQRLAIFGTGVNVSLLERPFRRGTLISTLNAALRARKRQFEMRDLVQALQESENRIRSFYEGSQDCIQEMDLQGRLLSINKNGRQLLEIEDYSRYHHRPWLDWWSGTGLKYAESGLADACAGRVSRFQGKCFTSKLRPRWFDVIISPVLGADGNPERILAISRDITTLQEQKESLRALSSQIEEQAELFRTTLANITDFAYIFDLQGRFLYANEPLLALWGLGLEEAVGKNFHDLKYPLPLAEKLQAQINHVIRTRTPVRDETPYVDVKGQVGYYEYIFTPVVSPEGTVTMVAGSTHVLTERKMHELELSRLVREREDQARLFDTTLSSITDLAYTFDLEGNWIYANKPLLEIWGKSLPEITGKSSLGLGYPVELADRLKAQVREVVQTRKPIRGETYFTDASGVVDYHEYIFSPVLAEDGSVVAVCGTTRLTTERKRQEAVAESHRKVMQLIAEDAPLQQALDELVRGVELGSPTKTYASVLLLDPDGVHLRPGAAPSLPADFVKAFDGLVIGPTAGCCGAAAFLKTPVHVADISTHPFWTAYKDLALSHGLHSCWSVPILSSRCNVLGSLAVYHLEPSEPTAEDLEMEAMAARTASIAIERKLSDAAVRESGRLYSQLVHTLPAAVYTTDAQGRLALYNEAAVALWGRKPEVGKDLWCGSYRILNLDGSVLPNNKWPVAVTLREQRPVGGREILIERPDGSRVNVLPSPHPIFDASGKLIGAVNMLLDVTESRRAEASSRRLAAIVESSVDAIISKNLDGIITSWNHGAERLFGYTPDEAIGQWVGMLMPESTRQGEEADILGRIRKGERIEHYETIRCHKDGRMIEVSLTVSPMRDAGGKIIGASKILRDITAQKRSERDLEDAHKKVVAASRAKDDFLAALSHELRTPLNPVLLTASESAEDEQLPEKVRSQFAMIRNNVELEARLIDDLLDITRITHDKLPLNLSLVDGHALLGESLRTVNAEIRQKHITLTEEFAAERSDLTADAVRLQQVFWNILKNAVKFTPDGGRISVQTRNEKQAGTFILTVSDTGVGMTPADIGRIFEAFAQGEHSNGEAHRFGGLGLGLAISRKLMDLHSGTIHAASDGPGRGSTFTVTMPLASAVKGESTVGKPVLGTSKKKEPNAIGVGVLLVEDHEPTREALSNMLSRRGYAVVTAASLAEARKVPASLYQVLVSDVGLPDGNGLDLMEELAAKIPGLQGIALTGYGMEDDLARTRAAGFSTHLTKPVRIQSLEEALRGLTLS